MKKKYSNKKKTSTGSMWNDMNRYKDDLAKKKDKAAKPKFLFGKKKHKPRIRLHQNYLTATVLILQAILSPYKKCLNMLQNLGYCMCVCINNFIGKTSNIKSFIYLWVECNAIVAGFLGASAKIGGAHRPVQMTF